MLSPKKKITKKEIKQDPLISTFDRQRIFIMSIRKILVTRLPH